MSMDWLLSLFNLEYIIQQQVQEQQYQQEQDEHVVDSMRKLQDFLDSLDKLDDRHKQIASMRFGVIIGNYIQKRRFN